MSWPSIEKAIVGHLTSVLGARFATRIPADVESLPRFGRIARGPGSDDLVTDSVGVDVECFAPDYGDSWDFAEATRQALHALSGAVAGGVLIDRVRTLSSPVWVDYKNPATNRFVATYRVEYRQILGGGDSAG